MWTGVEARAAKGTDREPPPLFRNRCTLPPHEWVPSISRPVNRMGYAAGSLSHQANRRASARKAANHWPRGSCCSTRAGPSGDSIKEDAIFYLRRISGFCDGPNNAS